MRTKPATPEKNSGVKLTIPSRTRSPLEAFQMLEVGQNVDLVAGYYEKEGYLDPDFYMLDHIGKLKELNKYKAMKAEKEAELKEYADSQQMAIAQANEAKQKQVFEKAVADEVAKRLNVTNQLPIT